MGTWQDIEPLNLSKKHAGHSWVFAVYAGPPAETDGGFRYVALLFRNADRTVFGTKELQDDGHSWRDLRLLAEKIVTDQSLRASLVSDDPDLPKLWKRH